MRMKIFWLISKNMAELFNVKTNTLSYYLNEIYESKENSTTQKIRVVQKERNRNDMNSRI